MDVISIEKTGISINTLNELNVTLKNSDLLVFLSIDLDTVAKKGLVNNMDVLKYIPNLRCLTMSNRSYKNTIVNSLDELSHLVHLKKLHITGDIFKTAISMDPLSKLKELIDVEIDVNATLSKKQQQFINSLSKLERLEVVKLDLEGLVPNETVKHLSIKRVLYNESLLFEKFPNLESLKLVQCSKVKDFQFINKMKNIRKICFWYMPQFEEFPIFDNLKNLEEIELIALKNFKSIDNILSYNKLKKFHINNMTKIPVSEFLRLKQLENLEKPRVLFMKSKDIEEYEKIIW